MSDAYSAIAAPADPYAAFSAHAAPKPGLLRDAWEGFKAPFVNLGHDVMEDYRGTQARAAAGAPTSAADLIKRNVDSIAQPAKVAVDAITAIPNALTGAVLHPASRLINDANPLQRYDPPHLSIDSSGVHISAARPLPLHGEEARAGVEGDLATALSAARPGARAPVAATWEGRVAAAAPKPAAMDLGTLTAAKDAAYQAVEASGVRFKPSAFAGLTKDMAQTMDAEGFHAGLHPKAASMIERIGEGQKATGGYGPTLTELDQLRQQIGRDVASSNDPGERRMGQIMRNKIDEFIDTAGPKQMTGSGSPDAAATLKTARDLNTRVMKLRSLDALDASAEDRAAASGTGTNGDNALRQNARRFQDQTDNLTPDEAAATRTAIRGTRVQNALRMAGRLSPEGGPVSALASIATGAKTFGVAPAAGFVARRAANALTQRNVQQLRNLIAAGGVKEAAATARPMTPPIASTPPVAVLSPAGLVGAREVLEPLHRKRARSQGRKD